MCWKTRLTLSVALALGSGTAFAADEIAGPRVRIELTRGVDASPDVMARQITGTLLDASEGRITVLPEGHRITTVTLPVASVVRLEVSQGRRSRGGSASRAAVLGLAIGGAFGALTGFLSGDDTCSYDSDPYTWDLCLFAFTREQKAVLGGIGVGAIGAGLGGLVGALSPGEVWRQVPVVGWGEGVSMGVAPVRGGGIAASVAVAF